jgi:hypothetical protein
VLSENYAACVVALRNAYGSAAALDDDRAAVEAAIEASRPAVDRAAAAAGPGPARKALRLHVATRFRDLRKDTFG